MRRVKIPKMVRVRQRLKGPKVEDVSNEVREKIRAFPFGKTAHPGQSVAITAGSRGIANIAEILSVVVAELRQLGLQPFVVPAMGSHGGATADGQTRILVQYGVTEQALGCPIRSSMEVAEVGKVEGVRVVCDRNAWEADHIVAVNRIKPHTDFDGRIESGLHKMLAVGLGKQRGAELYHRAGLEWGFAKIYTMVGQEILRSSRVLFGLGVVENGYDQTARIDALLPDAFVQEEPKLLRRAKAWMARLPFASLDLLIVDEMGKNISGCGMDPNVIGRPYVQKRPLAPNIRTIFVADLTRESEGNAIALGLADIVTTCLVDKIDYQATYLNAITGGTPSGAKIPMTFQTDEQAIAAALRMNGLTPPAAARIVRIRNTMELAELEVSEALLPEVAAHSSLALCGRPNEIEFDASGNLARWRPGQFVSVSSGCCVH